MGIKRKNAVLVFVMTGSGDDVHTDYLCGIKFVESYCVLCTANDRNSLCSGTGHSCACQASGHYFNGGQNP